MMATLAAVVGDTLPTNAGEDSYNMLPALRGEKLGGPIREATIHKQRATAIRAGRWKLIPHLGSGGFSMPRRADAKAGGPTGQLYDLKEDSGETRNMWSHEPGVVARLTGLLQRFREQGRSTPPRSAPTPSSSSPMTRASETQSFATDGSQRRGSSASPPGGCRLPTSIGAES